jgi:uncharacterized membrane protein YozB (DUF420 family)
MNLAAVVLACAVCFGDPNSAQVRGQNAGIFTLLGVITVVLTCFLIAIIRIARRSRQVKPLPSVG